MEGLMAELADTQHLGVRNLRLAEQTASGLAQQNRRVEGAARASHQKEAELSQCKVSINDS